MPLKPLRKREERAAKVLDTVPEIPFVWRPVAVPIDVAARLIGVSRVTVYALIRSGDLPRTVKIGRRTCVLYRDIEQMCERLAREV